MSNGDSLVMAGAAVATNDEDGAVVTPDMLYKLSKKIAQLTKVIYSLNTRNDDLEVDLEAVRQSYEEKLQILSKTSSQTTLVNGDVHNNNHE